MGGMPTEPDGHAITAKRALRAELRERRRIRPQHERESAADAITANLIALTSTLGPRSLSCYLAPHRRGNPDFNRAGRLPGTVSVTLP